jgi:hypothetical protein
MVMRAPLNAAQPAQKISTPPASGRSEFVLSQNPADSGKLLSFRRPLDAKALMPQM